VDHGPDGHHLRVAELHGARTRRSEQRLATALDDGGRADPVLVEQPGRREGVGKPLIAVERLEGYCST
jgi:hypothetical protein